MDLTEADFDLDLDCQEWRDGWDYGLDNVNGTLVRAVREAELRAWCAPNHDFDTGAFIRGRNAAIGAWHEHEREIACSENTGE